MKQKDRTHLIEMITEIEQLLNDASLTSDYSYDTLKKLLGHMKYVLVEASGSFISNSLVENYLSLIDCTVNYNQLKDPQVKKRLYDIYNYCGFIGGNMFLNEARLSPALV